VASLLAVTASSRRYFLVERYLPEGEVRSVVAATQQPTGAADRPRHVGTVVIAAEETCMSLFEAADAQSVATAIEATGRPADRIVEAEWFPGPSI
jgi:hypothetical protein